MSGPYWNGCWQWPDRNMEPPDSVIEEDEEEEEDDETDSE